MLTCCATCREGQELHLRSFQVCVVVSPLTMKNDHAGLFMLSNATMNGLQFAMTSIHHVFDTFEEREGQNVLPMLTHLEIDECP